MKIKQILPAVRNKFNHFVENIKVNKQIKEIQTQSAQKKETLAAQKRYMENLPIMLSDKAQEAVNAVNGIRNKEINRMAFSMEAIDAPPYKLKLSMENGDTVEVSRVREVNPNLDFTFFDKKGKKRESIKVATRNEVYENLPEIFLQTWNCKKGQVHGYENYRNRVMRPTDGLNRKRWHSMSFEETVNTRPIILKRINSLLENLGDEIKKIN